MHIVVPKPQAAIIEQMKALQAWEQVADIEEAMSVATLLQYWKLVLMLWILVEQEAAVEVAVFKVQTRTRQW